MADDSDKFGEALASNIRSARESLGMTVAGLAEASGVSRAMISKIERGEAQPTAVLLTRLSGALELTLSELIARAEGDAVRVSRRSEQTEWTDPETGYVRRAVSPPARGILELVEVEFPAGASVASPASAYHFREQQIWVLSGHLRFVEGDLVHELDAGDCLQLGPPADCVFVNPTDEPCCYLVVIGKRRG